MIAMPKMYAFQAAVDWSVNPKAQGDTNSHSPSSKFNQSCQRLGSIQYLLSGFPTFLGLSKRAERSAVSASWMAMNPRRLTSGQQALAVAVGDGPRSCLVRSKGAWWRLIVRIDRHPLEGKASFGLAAIHPGAAPVACLGRQTYGHCAQEASRCPVDSLHPEAWLPRGKHP